MDSEIVDAVTEWESSPFSGGYEGLRGLADRDFSGAVTQGTLWAFMLNGRLIEIEGDSISAFADTDGTAYEAPTPALPLLYAMQGQGEKQAQYYTNNKSISEANATLSSGNFTGYIELSENVLSGDYYTVYYGGKSRSVAFVGNSRKLLTDEEAFERADDEVGIYTVYAVDLDVTEIPEPATDSNETSGNDSDEKLTESSGEEPTAAVETPTDDSHESVANASDEDLTEGFVADEAQTSDESATPTAEASASNSASAASREQSTQTDSNTEPSANGDGGAQTATGGSATTVTEPPTDQPADEDVFNDEAEWRNAKSIPSLDPSNDHDQEKRQSTAQQSSSTAGGQQSASGSELSRKQLQSRLRRAEKIMQKAEQQHETLLKERDEALEELDTVRTQLSEAEAEVERLRDQLESSGSQQSTATQPMSVADALEGTNLLVRYASKGDSTLEDAASGDATQEEVKSNLRIEPHTTFASNEVTVDGTPFESFLDGRIELAFVRWLTEEFLFDIQQTGNQTELKGLYETIPTINRAELRGSVALETDDEDESIETTFDLVVRDKRDEPLFIANFNESKQPVGSGMIDSLVRDGSEIIQQNDSFAGAFAVTTSYYKGEALDAAADATGGSLLSASRGKSFVYISRKQGFHLCLVEKLGDTFDLHVPEL